jgi:hypothetical protein
MAGSSQHGDESSGTINGEEFLDWLSDCYILKKDYVQWS